MADVTIDRDNELNAEFETPTTGEIEGVSEIPEVFELSGNVEVPGGEVSGKIETISVNGVEQPIVDKNVDIPVPTKTSDLNNDSDFVKDDELARVAKSGDYNDLENTPYIPSTEGLASEEYVDDSISSHNSSEEAHQDIRDSIPSVEGLASETYVGNAISEHNTSSQSHQDIRTALAVINSKIPEQASDSNQLADKNFVNSSVSNNAAYFLDTLAIINDLHLTYDATMSQVISALNSYEFTSEKTNNDYCNVITEDSVGNTLFMRFKWNSKEDTFKYEFSLNNSSFTAVQWAAINSNATAENIAQIAQNVLAISALQSDVAGKVSKSGDTMTGDLNLTDSLIHTPKTTNVAGWTFGSGASQAYFHIDRCNQDGVTNPRTILRLNGSTDYNAIFRTNVYINNTATEEGNRLIPKSELDSTVANYLPLAGGELSGDLKIGENIVEFYSNGYYHRILSDSGSLRIQRSTNRTSWSGVATLYGASSNIVGFGEMRAQATTLTTDDTLTRRAHIYKQGIVSQTQTWTQASDGSYSYVMSNQVTGNIPISFIDKWNLLGSKYASSAYSHTFNESTGYFELNGLTDISYEEAMIIVEESQPFSMTGVVTKHARTNFAVLSSGVTITRFAQNSNIEVAYLAGASLKGANQTANFNNSKYLRTILSMRSQYLTTSYTFYNCSSLVTIDCYGSAAYSFKCNVIISGNNVLSIESLATMVRQRSDTNAFTITVDPAVYQRCQSDTTEYTYSGNTYTGIINYAAARNITIQSA